VLQVANRVYPAAGVHLNGFGAADNDMVFPSLDEENAAVNRIPLNPSIIDAVAQLLSIDATTLRLAQSELWSKLGTEAPPSIRSTLCTKTFDDSGNRNQRMHIDAFSHYLTFPSDWGAPEAVAAIVYYDDSDSTEGIKRK